MFSGFHRYFPRLRLDNYSEVLADPSFEQSEIPKEISTGFSEENLRLNLFYLWALKQMPFPFGSEAKASRFQVLDIGSKNFAYIAALHQWLRKSVGPLEIDGLELDAYPPYWNLFRRIDTARYYARLVQRRDPASKITYQSGDWLRDERSGWNLITCFYPFLYSDLHRRSRLPQKAFNPELFYSKMFRAANYVVLFHQGSTELQSSLDLIKKLSMNEVLYCEEFKENPWLPRKHSLGILLLKSLPDKSN